MSRTIGVIPARLGSTRLAEKILRPIGGRPMIQHVWERASRAKALAEVIVACDHERIRACVEAFGGRAVMTSPDHPNGSSRVAEIAAREKADVLINIQGDEPLIDPRAIDLLAAAFGDPVVRVATLAVRKRDSDDYPNPNVVKVVCAESGDALYFSRSPLPYYREPRPEPEFLKHLGLYGYRRDFLLEFVGWKTGVLEDAEKLEQLRMLERGVPIRVIVAPYDSWSVDTAADLEVVESKLKTSV